MHGIVLVISLVAGLQSVVAQSTSLYVPGFDPQPIDANIIGTADGSTTWALSPGSATDGDQGFVGTVTLVEGTAGAHLTYEDTLDSLTMGYDCTFSSGLAVCSGAANGASFTETETISSFAVALGTGTAAGASPTPTNSGSSQTSAGSSSAASTGSGSNSSPAPSQTGNSKNSGAKEVATSYVTLFGAVALVLSLL
ncbi:hypothetical protein BDP27DRAFT_1315659 [Rhodocollybia butyracea]|uniref:Uncharacterized protein n=1 Tax=Rhodocollybia butyracea TaxID=206335 RepID=A0A9P5Q5W7_9AGAR|nr:hypothetical protein BDP27DRAFT_1315659 [Rhodocollybia butyracea]